MKATAKQTEFYQVDEKLVEDMVRLCAFAQGLDYPDDLKLKGMAWCEIGTTFIPEIYIEQIQKVNQLYAKEELQYLKQHSEYPKVLKQAKRKFALQTLRDFR